MREWKLRRYWALMLVLLAGLATACDDDSGTDPVVVDEAQVLVDYVEASRGYDPHTGFITTAESVRTVQVTDPGAQYLIDLRAAGDYDTGHVEGAVNVPVGDLIGHLEGIDAASYDRIVLICYSGQTASYAVGVAKAVGFENVVAMKWGMSAWHTDFSGPWANTVANGNGYALQLETGASPAKAPAGDLPVLSTGFETGPEILAARAAQVITGFGEAKIGAGDVFLNLDDYYVINYWPQAEYEAGHIPGAVMYEPGTEPFTLATDLLTLPADEAIVIYCYTGQTSAYLTAYLRVLGYDAHTLLYGGNGMFYDAMPGHKFVPENEVKDYDYVRG